MKTRLITAGVSLVVLFLVLGLYYTIVFNAIAMVVCILALYEVNNAFKFKGGFNIFVGLTLYAIGIFALISFNLATHILILTYALIVYIAIIYILVYKNIRYGDFAGNILFSLLVIVMFTSAIYLKEMFLQTHFRSSSIYFMLLVFAASWGGDASAYFAGRVFGKRKLAPIISPNKTVEGAIGGVIGSIVTAILTSLVYFALFKDVVFFNTQNLQIVDFALIIVLSGISSVLGILGDLFASAIKRNYEIKDYGTIFPGHGGIMDRFDSVIFNMPFIVLFAEFIGKAM